MSKISQDDLWNRVVERWRESKIRIRPGASVDSIAEFETRFYVVVPLDSRDYLTMADGTGDDMDEMLYRFWPLAEIKPVQEELADTPHFKYPDRFSYPDCFVFADHCISCWDYAVRLNMDPNQPAPVFRVTGSDPSGEQMAPSFREFMTRYANDPQSII
jgi:hypothetical protein